MTGRGWATAGFLLGIAASVAGNIAHARPELGAQLAAAFYPVALLVTVEVLARVQWPAGRSWWLVRFGGAGLVAGVAGIVSYSHLHGLLVGYGETAVTAVLGPLSVDGLMVVSGVALLAIGRTAHAPVLENVPWVQVEQPVWWPPFGPVATPALGAPVPVVPQVEAGPQGDEADLDPALAEVVAAARDHFAEALSTGRVPSVRAIRRELRVGHPRAVAVRAALAE